MHCCNTDSRVVERVQKAVCSKRNTESCACLYACAHLVPTQSFPTCVTEIKQPHNTCSNMLRRGRHRRRVDLGGRVPRRVQQDVAPRSARHPQHGQRRTQHQRQSVFHHDRPLQLAGQQAHGVREVSGCCKQKGNEHKKAPHLVALSLSHKLLLHTGVLLLVWLLWWCVQGGEGHGRGADD